MPGSFTQPGQMHAACFSVPCDISGDKGPIPLLGIVLCIAALASVIKWVCSLCE